jgi:hypothetical protein
MPKYSKKAVKKLIGYIARQKFCPTELGLRKAGTCPARHLDCEKCWKIALKGGKA